MALITSDSVPTIQDQVALFSELPTNTTIENSFYVEYKPSTSIQDSDSKIEFKISGNANHYIDLADSFLYLKLKITDDEGNDIAANENVSTANNLLHSLFSQCDVFVNDQLISHSNNCYGYKAYIETLLSYGSDYFRSQGACPLFIKDTNGCDTDATNAGYTGRKAFILPTKPVELCDRLRFDLCSQERYLINNTNVTISLTRARNSFCLFYHPPANNAEELLEPKVKLLDASFFVRKQIPYPSIVLSHQRLLDAGKNCKYFYKASDVKYFTIASGNQTFIEENVFSGKLPSRIVVGLVAGSAFTGSYLHNPYKFDHFSLNYVSVAVNNVPIPTKPLSVDFKNNQALLPYYLLFSGLGIKSQDAGLIFDRAEYCNGNCLMAFDLDQTSMQGSTLSLEKTGNVRLELQFANPLKQSVTCIVYSESQKVLQIDKFRQVVTY